MNENTSSSEDQEAKIDLMSENGVVDYMSAATSRFDWQKRCDEVLAANGDIYPEFWYSKVLMSGLLTKVSASW